MMTIQQTPEMLDVARRVVWFKEPEETLRDPAHRETVVPLCINNVTLLIGAILLFMANGLVAHSQATPDQLAQGNLIPNGSFETGMAAGWGVSVRDGGFHDLPAAVDRSTAYAGKASLKVNIPPGAGTEMEISSPPVDITVPGTYTATIALKAANGPVGITVSLDNTGVSRTFAIGSDWQRVSVTGHADSGRTRLLVRNKPFGLQNVTAVWADAAELSYRSSPTIAYAAANPVELNLTTAQPGHAFLGRSPAVFQLDAAGDIPSGSNVQIVLTDLYGLRQALSPIAPWESTVTVQPDQSHPYGMFKLAATLCDPAGHALSAPVDCVFARLPTPRQIDPTSSFFGVHMPLLPAFFPIARAIGAHWVRLHDASQLTKWTVVQAEPGPFTYFDGPIKAARDAGFQILGMLDGAPAWTAIKPNPAGGYWAYFYNNPDGNDGQERWQDYVNAMVGHYKGKIDYWEVWNEPWNEQAPFFPGTPEQYGRLLKAAYKVAKIANPLATVLGIDAYRPIPTAKPDFTKRSLQASGSASYDAFSYHDYAPDILGDITGNVQINEAAAFYDLQREYGTSGPKPQWTTEGGVEAGVLSLYGAHNSGTDLMADQGRMVRFLVGLMAAGSQHFFLYSLDGAPKGYGNTDIVALEYDRAIRPQLAAYAVLAALVDGDGKPSIARSQPGVIAFEYHAKDGTKVNVQWSDDGNVHTISASGGTALDIQGNPLAKGADIRVGAIPIYTIYH